MAVSAGSDRAARTAGRTYGATTTTTRAGPPRDPAQGEAGGHRALAGQRGLGPDERLLAEAPLRLRERVVVIEVVDAVGLDGDEVAGDDRVADRPGHDGGGGAGGEEGRARERRAVASARVAPR